MPEFNSKGTKGGFYNIYDMWYLTQTWDRPGWYEIRPVGPECFHLFFINDKQEEPTTDEYHFYIWLERALTDEELRKADLKNIKA